MPTCRALHDLPRNAISNSSYHTAAVKRSFPLVAANSPKEESVGLRREETPSFYKEADLPYSTEITPVSDGFVTDTLPETVNKTAPTALTEQIEVQGISYVGSAAIAMLRSQRRHSGTPRVLPTSATPPPHIATPVCDVAHYGRSLRDRHVAIDCTFHASFSSFCRK